MLVVKLFRDVAKLTWAVQIDLVSAALLSNFIHYREAYITGSHGSTPKQHALALSLIENHKIEISQIVSNILPLNKIHDGFKIAASGNSAKVVINPITDTNHEN